VANIQKPVDRVQLSDLELDLHNPRFGESAQKFSSQADVVDWVVEQFGVDDVISSLAINGYFDAEPLIVVLNPATQKFVVKEGNRRLAACLILGQDPRAKEHWKKADALKKNGHGIGWSPATLVPVIKFDDSEATALLSYLGVRHIVSSQPWDSYAKAAWVSNVIANKQLTLDDIAEVLGDKNKTVARLLEGYNFVKQLVASGHFDPKSSMRRGRGSNVDYPFSWVYTLLGYTPVREWLTLGSQGALNEPIPAEHVDEAALTLRCMFGDKAKSIQPAISDSRQIGDLAVTLGNTQKRSLLKSGYTVSQIEEESQPIADRVSIQLLKARDSLREANGLLAEHDVAKEEARELIGIVASIRKQAAESNKTLNEVLNEDDDE